MITIGRSFLVVKRIRSPRERFVSNADECPKGVKGKNCNSLETNDDDSLEVKNTDWNHNFRFEEIDLQNEDVASRSFESVYLSTSRSSLFLIERTMSN